jgi:ParB family chromosome partitioning protein
MAKERKSLSDAVMRRFIEDPDSVQTILQSTEQPASTVPLNTIKLPTKRQPRRYFDPEKMAHLVASVKEHGILEPVLVRPLQNGNYELIAGERRLRAAQDVGLTEIPIVSKDFSDKEAMQVALMENLQREDLNPVEETEAILEILAIALDTNTEEVKSLIYQAANAKNRGQELKGNVSLQVETIEATLTQLGRFNLESLRSSRLPLLNLPNKILDALREGKLEYTKARAIARVPDEQQQAELLQEAIAQNFSLKEIKEQVKILKQIQNSNNLSETNDPASDPEKVITERMTDITKRLKKHKPWSDRKKQAKILRLLDQLHQLIPDE